MSPLNRLKLSSPVGLMLGLSIGSWLAAITFAGPRTGVDLLLGMLGPLTAATVTWALTERAYKLGPERLTALMVSGFGIKMVFFGAYVAVMLRVLAVRPVPFAASFTSYFIALYLIEAFYLRRLLMGRGNA